MEPNTSKKYKKRLIIILVLIIIAAFLSTFFGKVLYQSLQPTYEALDESIQTLQGTTDEEYQKIIEEKHPDVAEDSDLRDRQKTLDAFITVQDQIDSELYKYGEAGIAFAFYLAISGIFIGTMILVIMIVKIAKRLIKNLKEWLQIVIPVIVILLLTVINLGYYLIFTTYLGMVCQIPFLIYNIYKYIKLKKEEDKDDIIVKEETKEE